jgi:hypothetical protein
MRSQRERERAAVDAAAAAAVAAIDEAAGLTRPARGAEQEQDAVDAKEQRQGEAGAEEQAGTCAAQADWRWEREDSGPTSKAPAASWRDANGGGKLHKD